MRCGFVKGRKRADQQHHRNLREAFVVLNRAAKLVAVQARHEYISEDNIRRNMFEFFQRQPPVADRHYFHAFVTESQFNDFLHGGRVISQQQLSSGYQLIFLLFLGSSVVWRFRQVEPSTRLKSASRVLFGFSCLSGKALLTQGLSLISRSRFADLLGQQAALAWDVSVEFEISAYDDGLIRCDSDREGNVRDPVETWTAGCWHHPV